MAQTEKEIRLDELREFEKLLDRTSPNMCPERMYLKRRRAEIEKENTNVAVQA